MDNILNLIVEFSILIFFGGLYYIYQKRKILTYLKKEKEIAFEEIKEHIEQSWEAISNKEEAEIFLEVINTQLKTDMRLEVEQINKFISSLNEANSDLIQVVNYHFETLIKHS